MPRDSSGPSLIVTGDLIIKHFTAIQKQKAE